MHAATAAAAGTALPALCICVGREYVALRSQLGLQRSQVQLLQRSQL